MPEQIISIGFQLPGVEIEYKRFSERISLLDWDIAILSTNMGNSFYFGNDTYNGKACLSDDCSFKLTEGLNHWNKEIKDAYENGKSIIIFLDDYEEFYIATGQRTYSGTGRNQKVTRQVALSNNYSFIPLQIDARSSIGKSMIVESKVQYLKSFWEVFAKKISYKVTFEHKNIVPLLKTKSGNKLVGGIIHNKESGGYILLLPSIDFEDDAFIQIRGDKQYWSQKGKEFGGSLLSAVVNINKTIRNDSGKTPIPDWVSSEKYLLSDEILIRQSMVEKERKISKLQEEMNQSKEELNRVISIKDLLYEQGKPLERAILKALNQIGFQTSQYKENDSEFDVVFECVEGRLLGEAEGKDNKPINIEKLRQLEMNINEDFERDTVKTIAKGVLFGNPCRLLPIEKRTEHFTEKCQIAANRSRVALVKTPDLFFICQNITLLTDDDKANIRKKILESVGIIDFSEFINVKVEDDEERNA